MLSAAGYIYHYERNPLKNLDLWIGWWKTDGAAEFVERLSYIFRL